MRCPDSLVETAEPSMDLTMNLYRTSSAVAAALLVASSSANAGFLFETTPASTQATAMASQKAGAAATGGLTTSAGRNVDMSAKVDRMSKMNRQRIDLESRLSSRISQSGDTPPELPVIRGMGRDVTFEDALRQILPAGWSAYSDQDLPMEQKVNWSGNRTWPMVLHTLLNDKDMRAHVDWKNQEVMFFVPAAKEEVTKPVIADAKGVEVRAVDAKPVDKIAEVKEADKPLATEAAKPVAQADVKPAKVEVREVVWTLSPDHTLRENLRRWATAANWNLVWNAVNGDSVIDYPVDAKVEFPGELLGSSGAMAKVITAYRDADFPLEIEFFRGNRVVEVRLHRIPDVKTAATDSPAMAPSRAPLANPSASLPAQSRSN